MRTDLDIALLVPGMQIFSDWRDRSLGGSETAGMQMARALTALGHHVTLFCNTPGGGRDGELTGMSMARFGDYVRTVPTDVIIAQRQPIAFAQRTSSRLHLLWQHDLAVPAGREEFAAVQWNIDRCLVLSEFHKRQHMEVYGGDEGFYHVTRNGIDLSLFPEPDGEPREPAYLLYGARPERGLDVLVEKILPRIWARRPDVQLGVCTYSLSSPVELEVWSRIHELSVGKRVRSLGPLSKPRLYELYGWGTLYVYPTPSPLAPDFAEVSCISAMECMAAGLPVITSRRGALPETLHPDAGVLIDGDPSSEAYQEAFARAVIDLLGDGDRRRAMGEAGRRHAQTLGWEAVAKDWTERMWEWLDARNDRPGRLVRHFIGMSDIVPARAAVARMPEGPERDELRRALDESAGHSVADGSHPERYDRMSEDDWRLQWLVQQLALRPRAQRILDMGCGTGALQVWANQRLVKQGSTARDFTGVETRASVVETANRLLAERTRFPEKHRFLVGDEESAAALGPFDALVAFEILERVPEPWTFLARLERALTPDGEVLITVPSGPWEAPHRERIWNFDQHDLREMLGHKPGFTASYVPWQPSTRDLSPLGWWFVTYRASPEPARPIDLERHLRLQRPRETLSAVLLGGPGVEETLHWCLRSIKDVADEILLLDNGLSVEARRIAAQYPARVIPGLDPLAHGFDASRNHGLAAARMDWVLSIDCDERLMDPQNLFYYLRRNSLDGYSLRQHHFACDGVIPADIPVRLFRNNGSRADGREVRYWGVIHEHPGVSLNEGVGQTSVLPDVHLAHLGQLVQSGRTLRLARNHPLLVRDREKYPDRVFGHLLEMRENDMICALLLRQQGGKVTDEVRALCGRTVALHDDHFAGRDFYRGELLQHFNDDIKAYRARAAEMLERDGSVTFRFEENTWR